ncbi:PilZ domain-containing protein [Erythrobacter insulae]|nr:PilZ domain-containing protein [Erythrobacter insulae]
MATHPRVDNATSSEADLRAAPRFTLLIRAARLVAAEGEFVCVIRDVSETGISVRLFHALPKGNPLELHMPGGGTYELRPVWERNHEAGFEFTQPVEVSQLINEAGAYPKRGLRLGVFFPVAIKTFTQSCEGIVENLSQQGARFECDELFAIDQTIRLSSPAGLKEVRAKIRWRRDNQYGVVFEDTFTLGDFARLAARLQAPTLLSN